jgi:hypothetical protein
MRPRWLAAKPRRDAPKGNMNLEKLSQPKFDPDQHVLAMFLLWASRPRNPEPDEAGRYFIVQSCGTLKMNRREFFKLVIGTTCVAPLMMSGLLRKFPDDAMANEVNEFLFFRGLRPCPHSYHTNLTRAGTASSSSDEDFAECTGLARRSHGFYCISPDSVVCRNCGEGRRFFFNKRRTQNLEMRKLRAQRRFGVPESEVRPGLLRSIHG